MVVSLLLKVREEGAGALKQLRDGLMGVKAEDEALARAQASSSFYQFGASMRAGAMAAREMKTALGEVRKASSELFHSVLYGGLGAAGALFGFKEGFLDVAKEVGALRMRLVGLEGSDARADAALDWIKKFREHTNASLADVTEAWVELRLRGVNPVAGDMKMVANIAAVTGITMDEVARDIGNAAEGGPTRTLRALGVSVKEVGNLVEITSHRGDKVITDTVGKAQAQAKILEVLRAKWRDSDAAEKASQGVGGQMKKLGEVWDEFAMRVMGSGPGQGGVMKFLADQLGAFVEEAKEAGEGGKSFAGDLAALFKETIRLSIEFMKLAVHYLPKAIGALRDLSHVLGGPKVLAAALALVMAGPLIRALIGLGTTLVTTVIPAIYAVGTALMTTPVGWILGAIALLIIGAYELYEHWDEVCQWLGKAWDDVVDAVKFGVKSWVDQFEKLWDAIGGTGIGQALSATWSVIKGIIETNLAVIKALYDATIGPIIEGAEKLVHLVSTAKPSEFGGAVADADAAMPGMPSAKELEGRIKIDINVNSEGKASAKFSTQEDGGLRLDTALGFGMVF